VCLTSVVWVEAEGTILLLPSGYQSGQTHQSWLPMNSCHCVCVYRIHSNDASDASASATGRKLAGESWSVPNAGKPVTEITRMRQNAQTVQAIIQTSTETAEVDHGKTSENN